VSIPNISKEVFANGGSEPGVGRRVLRRAAVGPPIWPKTIGKGADKLSMPVACDTAFLAKTIREESVWDVLNRNLFFVKDAVKVSEAKFSDKLDLYDPDQQSVVLQVREPDITTMTKVSRLYGGTYDRGSAFDLVANYGDTTHQVLRVTRGSSTFVLNGAPVDIGNHRGAVIGSLKKIVWTVGRKYKFTDRASDESLTFELRTNVFGSEVGVVIGDKKVAGVVRKWKDSHEEYFKAGKFGYALWISPEVEKNSQLRQALIAFGISQHRVMP
jgi:hypothetical protein